jgi:hypothetical protein
MVRSESFEAERHFNRVKGRRVLRQIPHHCTSRLNRVLHAPGTLCAGGLPITPTSLRLSVAATLLNIGQEDFPVHWPINDHRRYHLIMTQGGYERHRLPRSLRNVTDQAHAARAGSPETDHIGGGRSLIEEYQSGRIEKRLLPYPAPPRASHIRAMLLRRPQVFFNSDVMPIEKTPERAAAARKSVAYASPRPAHPGFDPGYSAMISRMRPVAPANSASTSLCNILAFFVGLSGVCGLSSLGDLAPRMRHL